MESTSDFAATKRPSLWWTLLPVALTILCLVLTFVIYHYRDNYLQIQDDYRSLSFRSENLETDNDRLRELIRQVEFPPLQVQPTMTDLELATFRKVGLDDPYESLAENLVSNPHLDGVEFGEYIFEDTSLICILGPDRAVAHFDGSIGRGLALLSYQVQAGNDITWRILKTEIITQNEGDS